MFNKAPYILILLFLINALLWIYGRSEIAYVVAGITLIYLSVCVIGSMRIQWNIFLKSTNKLSTDKSILLTFDDGPDEARTPIILEILKKYNAKAVFFCIGTKMEKHPELVRLIHSQGHIVANHTWSHSYHNGFLSTSAVKEELRKTEEIIESLLGYSSKWFRPPFGVTNPNIADAVNALGLKSMGWSRRSLDTTTKATEKVLSHVLPPQDGDIVLFHDTQNVTAQVLDRYLSEVVKKGFNVQTNSVRNDS